MSKDIEICQKLGQSPHAVNMLLSATGLGKQATFEVIIRAVRLYLKDKENKQVWVSNFVRVPGCCISSRIHRDADGITWILGQKRGYPIPAVVVATEEDLEFVIGAIRLGGVAFIYLKEEINTSLPYVRLMPPASISVLWSLQENTTLKLPEEQPYQALRGLIYLLHKGIMPVDLLKAIKALWG